MRVGENWPLGGKINPLAHIARPHARTWKFSKMQQMTRVVAQRVLFSMWTYSAF